MNEWILEEEEKTVSAGCDKERLGEDNNNNNDNDNWCLYE